MAHTYKRTLINTLVLSALYHSASAEVITDGTVGDAVDLQATTDNVYEITSDLGHTSGNNLFHSFEQFNIETNYTADFSGPANIQNIINRVTGPDASNIDGTLRSSIQGANLYLLNPNGVIFGANASLDITGSFYTSTADYLKFGDNEFFYADANEQSTFVSAEPSAFGFTSSTPNNIQLNGSELSVDDGQTLSLIGGDISLDGAQIRAPDGRINVASVASQGEVIPTTDDLQMSGFAKLGDIGLTNGSNINVNGNSSGQIIIRGGTLTLDQSSIQSNTEGAGTDNEQKTIDIATSTSITLNNFSDISTEVLTDGDNNGADIEIDTDKLLLSEYSSINSSTVGSGDGGDINLNADELTIEDASRITTSSETSADTGNITIQSGNIIITGLEVTDDPFRNNLTGIISSKDFGSPSEGGNINIFNTGDLTLDRRSTIKSVNKNATDGGDITIKSNTFNILRGSQLVSDAQGAKSGDGGEINITADTLNVVGYYNAAHTSSIYVNGPHSLFPIATGDTGNIDITVAMLNLLDGGRIRSRSNQSTGTTGSISIKAQDIHVSGLNVEEKNDAIAGGTPVDEAIEVASSHIIARSFFKDIFRRGVTPATIGNISITSKNLVMDSNTYISTQTRGDTNSHDIIISANYLELRDGAYLTSSASTGNGNAGNITIIADNIDIDGPGGESRPAGIYSKTNEKISDTSGGDISIQSNRLRLENGAIITSETSLDGDGGDISINSEEIVYLSNGARITTSATDQSTGNAGNVNINTNVFALEGSSITTNAIEGQGGNINISANNLIISEDSEINAASEQSVDGEINITNNSNVISSLAQLTEESTDVASQFKNECFNSGSGSSHFSVNNSLVSNQAVAQIPSNYNSTQNSFISNPEKTVKNQATHSTNMTRPLTQVAWRLTNNCQ